MDNATNPLQAAGYFQAAPIGMLLLDGKGLVLTINPTAMSMLGIDEGTNVVEKPVLDLFGSDAKEEREAIADSLALGGERKFRSFCKTVFGARLDCDLQIVPLNAQQDEQGLFQLFLLDRSEETGFQQNLILAERLSSLGELVAGVAHELNNPLTGILGYAQIVQAGTSDDKTRQRLDRIVTEAQRCQSIVSNLLAFASLSDSQKSLCDINEVIEGLLAIREYQMRVDGIVTTITLGKNLPTLYIDQSEFFRILLNIVNNAHYALLQVPEDSRQFEIETTLIEKNVVVELRDSGIGISAKDLPRIFDPFFTTKDYGEGAGLGLSVAYGIVRDHGGQIEAISEPGKGTTLRLTIPPAEKP